MKTKRKVKLNWLSLTGLACFSLQEYQHVHLLWFKKRSFILVWKPNPPLRSVRGTHLRARADVSINQALHLKHSHWKLLSSWSVKSDSCYNVLRLAARAVWSRRFGAAQTMHSHKCDHVKFLLTLSKNGHSLEPCSGHLLPSLQSATLIQIERSDERGQKQNRK